MGLTDFSKKQSINYLKSLRLGPKVERNGTKFIIKPKPGDYCSMGDVGSFDLTSLPLAHEKNMTIEDTQHDKVQHKIMIEPTYVAIGLLLNAAGFDHVSKSKVVAWGLIK